MLTLRPDVLRQQARFRVPIAVPAMLVNHLALLFAAAVFGREAVAVLERTGLLMLAAPLALAVLLASLLLDQVLRLRPASGRDNAATLVGAWLVENLRVGALLLALVVLVQILFLQVA
jgi:hypothetical protein